MEHPPESGTTRQELADFLRRERSRILVDWAQASESARVHEVDHGTLIDHLPGFIEAVARCVENGEAGKLARHADMHALVRLEAGYSLEEVIREYAVLRSVILEHWHALHPDASNIRLNRAIDDAVAQSVSWFGRSRQRTLQALDRISAVAFKSHDLDELLLSLLRVVVGTVESVDAAALFLRDGDLLRLRTTVGLERDAELGLTMKIGEGFGGTVAATREPRELRRAADEPLVRSTAIHEKGIRALYGLPLLRSGKVIGVAELGSRTVWEFSAADKLLFRTMVDRVTAAISVQRLHDKLLAEKTRIGLVTELLPVAVFVTDETGRIVEMNRGARNLWGEDVEKLRGTTNHEAFRARQPDDHTPIQDWGAPRALRSGETIRNEMLEILTFDEAWRTIWGSAAPLKTEDGQVFGAVEVHADITEMRQREEELRFFAEVSTALSETLDLDKTLERVARLAVPRLADWCGIDLVEDTGDERTGPALRRVALTHVDQRIERLTRAIARRFAPGLLFPGSRRVVADGKPLLVSDVSEAFVQEFAISPEHAEAIRSLDLRSYLCVPMILRDRIVGAITLSTGPSRRRYEEHDLRVAQELAWRATLAVENARLYAEAQQAIRTRDELWDIAAHELRNPLTAVHLQIATALRQVNRAPQDFDRLTSKLRAADRQVERLIALTNELLDTTRARSGRLEIRPEPMDFAALVREVVNSYRSQTEAAGVEVDCQVEGELRGRWDPVRLEQVVTNLLSNAVKYGRGRPIRVRLCSTGGRARLEVKDEGIGISREDQRRLFRPFERAPGSREVTGLGLGLYVSRIIVEAHHGRLTVRSTPGVCSVFTVELPLDIGSDGVEA